MRLKMCLNKPSPPAPLPFERERGAEGGVRESEGSQRQGERLCFLILTLLFIFLFSLDLRAAPVTPTLYTLHQPDSSTFLARSYGDEWANGVETHDGFTIVLNQKTRVWEYASRSSDGRLQPSGVPVGKTRPLGLVPHLRPDPVSSVRPAHHLNPALEGAPIDPCSGPAINGKTLVILVSFQDQAPIGTTPETWHNTFFGSSQSVKDFYRAASYGQLQLTEAAETHGAVNDGIIGWLTLNRNHPDTRENINGENRLLAAEALQAADPYVDFSTFDTNHDGKVSSCELHIVIIVAGYDAAFGGAGASCTPHSIWAHHWALQPGEAPTLDGVLVGDEASGGGYAEFGEWHCAAFDSPGHAATIGVIAHEMGHDLGRGILDLYDIDGTSWGIGDWDLMSTGAWNGIHALGDSPAYPSAWTKWFWGWINPIPVQGQQVGVTLGDAARNAGAFYLLGQNPNGVDWTRWQVGTGEYFLIENRQNVGYDAALPGHGLLIWHIDESVEDNSDETHRLVDLEEASGTQNLDCVSRPGICPDGNQGNAGDPFPGQNNVRAFNATTVPTSNFYSGAPSQVSLSNIVESDQSGVTLDAQTPGTGTPPSVNQAPTANAGANRTVELGTPVTLDGTSSSDPDRDTLQYKWLVTVAPGGSKIKPGKSFSGPMSRFTPDQEGHYAFKLTVDDQRGGVNSAIVEIFAVATELFHDDMESSAVIWSASGSTQRLTRSSLACNLPTANEKSSGEYVWYLGNPSQCIYDSSATLLSPSINVQGVIKLGLSFNYFLQLRKGDQVEVSVSFDGSARWRKLWSKPQQGSWTSLGLRTFFVPQGTRTMLLRFRLLNTSKFRNAAPGLGWLLDDVRIIKLSGSPSARMPGTDPNDLDQLHKILFDSLRLPETQGWTARAEIFGIDGHLIDRTEWVSVGEESLRWPLLRQSERLPANGVYWIVLTLRSPEGHITRKLIPFAWLRSKL